MKKFPELKTAKILSENEISTIRGGSCDSCTNGCKETCKQSCSPGGKNAVIITIPLEKDTKTQ